MKYFFYLISFVMLSGCSSCRKISSSAKKPGLKFLNEYVIPYGFVFDSTHVGGLSGIDYDKSTNMYTSISDDRSDTNPARYYTYRINLKDDRIDTVVFLRRTYLKNIDGEYFPSFISSKKGSIDPEALRYYKDKIFWSSEGTRIINEKDTFLENPRIFISDTNGHYLDTFYLPPNLRASALEKGVRNNGGFEGLAISPDQRYLYASVEEPLINDGPRAGIHDTAGIVRIIKYDIASRRPKAQYAYGIDPVAHPVVPASGFRVNGISDILCLDERRLLVIERSYSTGRLSCTIKVYVADLKNARDVSDVASFRGKSVSVAPKKLILNMDDLGFFIDNIEGVTFGPQLPNGKPSMIFVSDDNFNPLNKTQLLLFEWSDPR